MKRTILIFFFIFLVCNYTYSNIYKFQIRSSYVYDWTCCEITISNTIEQTVPFEIYFSNSIEINPENDKLIYSSTIEPSRKIVIKKDENQKKILIGAYTKTIYIKTDEQVPFISIFAKEKVSSTFKYTFEICNKPTYEAIENTDYYVGNNSSYLYVNISDEEHYIPLVYNVYCDYAGNELVKGVVYNTYQLANKEDINNIHYSKIPVYRPFYTQEQKDFVYEELRNVYLEYKEYKKHYEEYINTTLVNTSSYKYLNTPQIIMFSRKHNIGQQYIADITYYEMSRVDENHYYLYGQLSNCVIEYTGNLRFDFSTCYRLLTYQGTVTVTRADGIMMELPFYTCSSEKININHEIMENIKNQGERWDLLGIDFSNKELKKQLWPDKYN